MDRKELYKRINNRVDLMIEKGLEKEVKSLSDCKESNSMQTVGYSEWFDYFDGKISLFLVLLQQVFKNEHLNTFFTLSKRP